MSSVSLAQIGEFSFIIASEAAGRIRNHQPAFNSLILSVAIISIALTPMLLLGTCWLYRLLAHGERTESRGRR